MTSRFRFNAGAVVRVVSVVCCFLLPLLAAAIMVLNWPIAPDNDLYFHLKCGEIILRGGKTIHKDPFTYTAAGTPDESSHSSLSQVIFWLIYREWGFRGLRALNLFLVGTMLVSLWGYLWRRCRNEYYCLSLVTIALLVHHHVQILRPILFTEALLAIVLFTLLDGLRNLSQKAMAGAFVASLCWAHLHGSAVVMIPISVVLAVLGCRERKREWVLFPVLVLVAIGISPMGISLLRYSVELTRLGKTVGNYEWLSQLPFRLWFPFARPAQLDLQLGMPTLVQLFAAGWVLVLLWKRRGRGLCSRDAASVCLAVFFLLIPLISRRHSLFLVGVVGLVGGMVWDGGLRARFQMKPLLAGLASIVFAVVALASFPFYQSGFVIPSMDKMSMLLEGARLRGNLFTDPNWGSYIIYRHFPDLRVAYDSRTMVHEEYFRRNRKIRERFGAYAPKFLLEHVPENTDMILISSWIPSPLWSLDPKQWSLVFENNHAVLFLRRDARNTENFARLSNYYRSVGVSFSAEVGFRAASAFREAPRWYRSLWEEMPWGRWPTREALEHWRYQQRVYFESRQIPIANG